jgi:hypothetical protein
MKSHLHFSVHFPGAAVRAAASVKATIKMGDISPDPIIQQIMINMIVDNKCEYYTRHFRSLQEALSCLAGRRNRLRADDGSMS